MSCHTRLFVKKNWTCCEQSAYNTEMLQNCKPSLTAKKKIFHKFWLMADYINYRETKQRMSYIHHILFIFVIFVINGSFLILLVFRNQIIHIGLSFGELHFVHTFAGVPMQKCFSSKHSSKLFRNSFEHFLNGSRISNKSRSHFKTIRWNITNRCFDVVRNPFNKV